MGGTDPRAVPPFVLLLWIGFGRLWPFEQILWWELSVMSNHTVVAISSTPDASERVCVQGDLHTNERALVRLLGC